MTFRNFLDEAKTTMKNASGDDTNVYYTKGHFYWNGEDLGSDIKKAKEKLIQLTDNFMKRNKMNAEEKKSAELVKKSIDRHFKKLQKTEEPFDWFKSL